MFHVVQRHYSQLKDELLKLKRPSDDGAAETVAASDLVSSDTTCSSAVNGDTVLADNSAADVPAPADMMQDMSGSVLPSSDASSTAGSTLLDTVTNAASDCDSVVTDSSSAAVV